ncbi:putative benzyl alcohol O-benzoyltransferase [Helianthus annuus]|uniref:Benzyl alcohol O-benzoyltransferase n=1 Tax=Helianthus annuus TaxID=4232 RepID=A0A251TGN8_HELAN|nr:benzyl alcohol O-benzoyltransferase [Helianthus annuus]KAF5783987.1 putative benzyl alcohol O-benzoyltransferase [Helianthus annuus]KAJ0503222.1 putative benzyl alcohol O-benzoyltransferase [Helianthus annuus]KAJ0511511.1 putative benzyl alcohol O-benzoyltransferase [Helianthus annuus]KAJ0519195.1 putative benzyl alcohol O-benzoyltransferase [Helianthus annuus]KAJ0687185.1 putative benzyl alcohol O-benzoyltransferase [Helianthus annuus]
MSQQTTTTPLTFTVRRHEPELIVPAKPTPRELKPLSDIDDQEGLRFHIPLIHIYQSNPKMGNKNPASVIRDALAKALVFYYPFAGRLKEGPGRKLMVDCSGQGALFIEAEADVTLKQFGVELQPPFPCREELLYDVPGSSGILDSPLLLIQVTRLLCGAFILVVRFSHTMCDAFGYVQFLTALSEMAKGASTPSTLPIWQRELLCARDPPRVTCIHHEYDDVADTDGITIPLENMETRSFFFGPTEISAIRRFVPTHLKRCTTFEVLTACLWRCRTIALQPNPDDEMRMMTIVNARLKFNPRIPVGYYGNVFAYPAAMSKARDLCNKPLGHALELVMKAKSEVTEEYLKSVADLMVIKGRPNFTTVGSYIVSDVTRAGLLEIDFGWGYAVYAGPDYHVAGFYTRHINHKGESGIVVPIWLPCVAMKRFVKELDIMLARDDNNDHVNHKHVLAHSKL